MKNHEDPPRIRASAEPSAPIHEEIAARAHAQWIKDGRPQDAGETRWLLAERELIAERATPPDSGLPVSF